jgi:streptogramin lyase
MVSGVGLAGPLASGLSGAGGSWDVTGSGETINYACFAYAISGSAAACGGGAGVNTLEDTFQRADQAGWGVTVNADGVPDVTWGLDGGGSLSNVTIASSTGQYAYPGSTNQIGIAAAGSGTYDAGDSLVEFSVSAAGHATPYVVQNACADKSCYYGARLHTSAGRLEVAERAGGSTGILAAVPFTASAGTHYWMRLDVAYVAGASSEHSTGGVGDPWGTAIDSAGDVWFAEPGCDFGNTCTSSTPPGQIAELVAASGTFKRYTLPNIANNQPIFVSLDASGNVWFTTPNNSMIGEFNPATQAYVGQWSVTSGSGPWDLTFNNGQIWYTEHYVSAVGSFNPVTHAHTDVKTPTANSNPYGIVASDPANGNLVWFTENNGSVARIGVVDTANSNAVSEYLIRAQLPSGSALTPHLITLDSQGHPWWTEGWIHDIGTLDPAQATAGSCGNGSGDCLGVTEHSPPLGGCGNSHLSGIALAGSHAIWIDDSISGQIFSFDRSTGQFVSYATSCGPHPHDGLNVDASSTVWWDEEFNNSIGMLIP